VLRNLERLLLSLGLGMMSVFVAGSICGAVASNAELRLFRAVQTSSLRGNPVLGSPAIDLSLWSPQRIRYYRETLAKHFDPPLAVLRISKVGVEVPVLEGTNDLVLNRGVGHIPGTSLPGRSGTVGIAGHRDAFFRVLKDVGVGDTIELETYVGKYDYRVTQILVVDPTDVSVLQTHTTPSLTLVTCYPFYFVGSAPQRYIVEASLESAASSNKGKSKSMQEVSR
jgi:sortase A